jgi:hypothetical protein
MIIDFDFYCHCDRLSYTSPATLHQSIVLLLFLHKQKPCSQPSRDLRSTHSKPSLPPSRDLCLLSSTPCSSHSCSLCWLRSTTCPLPSSDHRPLSMTTRPSLSNDLGSPRPTFSYESSCDPFATACCLTGSTAPSRVRSPEHSVEALQHVVPELDCSLAAQDEQQFLQPEDCHARCVSLPLSFKFELLPFWQNISHFILIV